MKLKKLTSGLVLCSLLTLIACGESGTGVSGSISSSSSTGSTSSTASSSSSSSAEDEPTKGLKYEYNEDENVYDVSVGTAKQKEYVYIPGEYDDGEHGLLPCAVAEDAFKSGSDNRYMKRLTIADGVVAIKDCAFNRCVVLETVKIGNDVKSIGASAFACNYQLSSIDFGYRVRTIDHFAFLCCSSLKTVKLSLGLYEMGYGVFSGCKNLETLDFSDGVIKVIPDSTCMSCPDLVNLSFPDSLETIEQGAFYGNTNTFNVKFYGTEEQWNEVSIGGNNGSLTDGTYKISYV